MAASNVLLALLTRAKLYLFQAESRLVKTATKVTTYLIIFF